MRLPAPSSLVQILVVAILVAAAMLGAAPARAAAAEAPASFRVAPVASDARVAGDDSRTRLVFDLSEAVEMGVFPLADPYRLVIDLPETRFALPPDSGQKGRGLVSAWRYGLLAPGKSRIVVDLAGPAVVDRAFVLPPMESQPARLVIDVVASTRERTLAAVAEARERRGTAAAEVPPPVVASKAGRLRPLVVIDPGHGGIDGGATGVNGTREKDITLRFALELRDALVKQGGLDVRLTRGDDVFISLNDRVDAARALAADLFISIHADAAPQDYVRGATVYTVSDRASDAEAAAIAAQENRSDAIAGLDLTEAPDDVTDILIDLARRETKSLSNRAADIVVGELGNVGKLATNPHRQVGFWILRAHDVPSVLVELGYLTNRHDEALMLDQEWHDRMVAAMAAAIVQFFTPQVAAGATAAAQ